LAFELYDLDNDGIDEIISADYSETFLTTASNRLTVHKRSSSQELYTEVYNNSSQSQFYSQDMGATSFEIHDFNNDGITDIGIAREGEGKRSFEIWIGEGDLSFTPFFSKSFNPSDFNFQEFEVMDVNKDGNLDIVLRPTMNGGEPTELFMYSSYDKGIRLNDCIWINDGTGKFNPYDNKELTSTVYTKTLFPFMENEILHFVGFEFEDWKYNSQNNTLEVDVIDLEVEIK